MTPFEQEVARALAAIPHANTCWCSKGAEAYKMGPCICYAERETKLARHVAAALEAAVPVTWLTDDGWRKNPLDALRGARRAPAETPDG